MTNNAIEPIRMQATYPHSIERVWKALTTPDEIAAWLMKNDFKAELGHKFQFRSEPMGDWNGIVDAEVVVLEEPHKLAYTWSSGPHNTLVTWTLQGTADGTLLTLEHSGFAGPEGEMLRQILSNGWPGIMNKGIAAVLDGERS